MFRKILFSLVLLMSTQICAVSVPKGWIRELFLVGRMIERVDPVFVACANCSYNYSCEAFFGTMWADVHTNEVNDLKVLLEQKNEDNISKFMFNVANERKIHCVACKQYYGWNLIANNVSVKEDAVKSQEFCIKRALSVAFLTSEVGKKLYAHVEKIKKFSDRNLTEIYRDMALDEVRTVLPNYTIKPEMEGFYPDWPLSYKLPQKGSGTVRFTTKMKDNITIGFSSTQLSSNDMYEIALGVDGKAVLRKQPQGDPEVSVDFSITDPITIEITLDKFLNRILVEKVRHDGSKLIILEYGGFVANDIQFFAFTGVKHGGKIVDLHVKPVVYSAVKSIKELEVIALLFIQSALDDKYLEVQDDGYIKASSNHAHLGRRFQGIFISLTDGEVILFIDVFNGQCGILACLPPGNSEAYVLRSVADNIMSDGSFFELHFDADAGSHNIVYIKNLATDGYLRNPYGGKITTVNPLGRPAGAGKLEQFKIRPLIVLT